MPAISYREFSGGLDRRLPIGVQDANRLWTLTNAYVTAGHKIAKRPGLSLSSGVLTGSVGLASLNGQLVVFVEDGSGFSPPAGLAVIALSRVPNGDDTYAVLEDVLYAENFQGYPYVVAQYYGAYTDGSGIIRRGTIYRHHYVDGGASTLIADINCPRTGSVTKAASRIFAIGDDVVRYCAAGAARDWTTADDAGFLPVSLQQDTRGDPTAVGTFEDALVVFFADGSQVWDVAVDPSANQIRRRLSGVGTLHPQSLSAFYRDLVFASPFGARSMSVQENVERIDETDVGVPIDKVLVPVQKTHATTSSMPVRGRWLQQFGQYWLTYATDSGSTVFAYSFSKSSKLACWSTYTLPVAISGMATLNGATYLRDAGSLYEVAEDAHTDNGTLIPVDVQMAFQDAKSPGVEKMFYGADYVFSGTATVSYLYDPHEPARETIPQTVTGDTRAQTLVPVEISSAAIAPRFRHQADEAFSLDLATLYFHTLSASAG